MQSRVDNEIPSAPDIREDALYARVTRRIVSFLFVCFIFAFLDRINVGFAKLGMQADLGFSEAVFGLGAGIFFITYFLLEVPSNLVLARVGARRWIARIMVTWGILSICTMFVQTPTQFYIVRLLLGAAEAGFFPGVMLYLTQWYPAPRRSRVITLFMAAIPVSCILGSPLSGWIMQAFARQGDLAAWQWLYLIEGMPAVILGLLTLRLLPDSIRHAKWLSADEQQLLQQRVAGDAKHSGPHRMRDVFRTPLVWLLAFINFAFLTGLTLAFWMPSILQNAGVTSTVDIGLLVALPYALAIIGMLLLGRTSDAFVERRWHCAVPAFIAALSVAVMPFVLQNAALLLIASAGAIGGNVIANALYWNLPTAIMSGVAATVGLAFVNALGQLAGFSGPALFGWLFSTTGSISPGLGLLAACLALGGVAVLLIPEKLVNR